MIYNAKYIYTLVQLSYSMHRIKAIILETHNIYPHYQQHCYALFNLFLYNSYKYCYLKRLLHGFMLQGIICDFPYSKRKEFLQKIGYQNVKVKSVKFQLHKIPVKRRLQQTILQLRKEFIKILYKIYFIG